MGTNYYHRTATCEACGRYDDQHICKSMSSFEAVIDWHTGAVMVGSWQAWKALLLDGGEVWDEYDEHWSTEDFIAQVEAVRPDSRRRQFDWVRANATQMIAVNGGPEPSRYWLDDDGFSFYGGAFS